MRALYHIDQELQAINDELIASQGEISDELFNKLAITQTELAEKSANYGLVILSNEADSKAIDAEIKRLKAMKDGIDSATAKLKETIGFAMQKYELSEVKTPLVKMSFRSSKSVHIIDESLLDAKYFDYKPTVNKTAIKSDIEAGVIVEGATILEKQNLQVK
jgi:hypothetical protein